MFEELHKGTGLYHTEWRISRAITTASSSLVDICLSWTPTMSSDLIQTLHDEGRPLLVPQHRTGDSFIFPFFSKPTSLSHRPSVRWFSWRYATRNISTGKDGWGTPTLEAGSPNDYIVADLHPQLWVFMSSRRLVLEGS